MNPETEALIARTLDHDGKATKGPLRSLKGVHYVAGPDCIVAKCGDYQDKACEEFSGERWQADADMFAAYRTDAPKLARMLRAAVGALCLTATIKDSSGALLALRETTLAEIEKIARES